MRTIILMTTVVLLAGVVVGCSGMNQPAKVEKDSALPAFLSTTRPEEMGVDKYVEYLLNHPDEMERASVISKAYQQIREHRDPAFKTRDLEIQQSKDALDFYREHNGVFFILLALLDHHLDVQLYALKSFSELPPEIKRKSRNDFIDRATIVILRDSGSHLLTEPLESHEEAAGYHFLIRGLVNQSLQLMSDNNKALIEDDNMEISEFIKTAGNWLESHHE